MKEKNLLIKSIGLITCIGTGLIMLRASRTKYGVPKSWLEGIEI